jgi:branched-chain amino acid transport system substrate-binding protein
MDETRKRERDNAAGIDRRRLLRGGAVLAGAAIAGAPYVIVRPAGAQDRGPIRLGNIEPLSGPYADSGRDEMEGAQLANEEFNARGGVLGRKIEMITEDAPSNPGIGVQKAIKLIQRDRVHFLTGTLTSSVTVAVSDVAAKERVLFMAFGSHADDTTGSRSHRTTFRTTAQNYMLSTAVATWIGKNWKPRTVYHLTADYVWGHSARDSMNRVFGRFGVKEIGNDFFPLGTSDFSSLLIKVRGAKPDVLVVNAYGADQINSVKQFKEFGLGREIKLCGPLSGTPMMKGIGTAADGVWGLSWHSTLDTPGSKKLRDALMKRYAAQKPPEWRPSYRHYLGYITHVQLLEAIERARTTDKCAVIKALEGHKFDGLKWTQSEWRAWDHQHIQDVIVARARRDAGWKSEDDYFEILAHIPGQEAAPSREEWKRMGGRELEPMSAIGCA